MRNILTKTFKAGTALERYRLVRPSATVDGECDYPAAGYAGPLFVTEEAADADKSVACVPLEAFTGTLLGTCAAAVTRGARLFLSGAAGKMSSTPSATPLPLVALQTTTEDGEAFEVAAAAAGSQVVYASLADSAEVEDTVTVTAFDKSVTLDGPSLKAGDVLHIRARAFVLDNNSTDTLTLKLLIGTEEIATTGAVDVADSDIGYIDAMVVIREGGATGKLSASGVVALGVPGTVTAKPFRKDEAAEDLSGAVAITVTAGWSVAHADNEVYLEDLIVIHHKA